MPDSSLKPVFWRNNITGNKAKILELKSEGHMRGLIKRNRSQWSRQWDLHWWGTKDVHLTEQLEKDRNEGGDELRVVLKGKLEVLDSAEMSC